MKRIMPASFALTLLAAAPAAAADRSFTVSDFDRIQVEGPFEVVLTTGKAPSARATGSTQALDRISVDVQGRMLRIRPDRSGRGGYPGEGTDAVRLLVSTHGLRSAGVLGSGSLAVDTVKAMRFDISVSGSGRIGIGRIEADALVIGLVGSGSIKAAGAAKTLRATIQGSGDLAAGALTAGDADIKADTSGTIEIAVRGSARVTATGAGDTVISGHPACTVKALGSGLVRCGR
jgi:hypothetical protein